MESFRIQYLTFKRFLHTHAKQVGIFCVLGILIIGGILGLGVVDDPIQDQLLEEEEDPIPEKTHQISLQYNETAEVTQQTQLYSTGETIENNSLYPLSATNFTIETTANTQNITVTSLENKFVYRGVRQTDASEVVWEKESEETVTEKTTPTLSQLNFPMTEIQERISQYREVYSTAVNIRPQLQTTVTYEYTSPTGETFNRQFTSTGDLRFVENGYTISYSNTENLHTTGGIEQNTGVSTINQLLLGVIGLLVVTAVYTKLVTRYNDPQKLSQTIKNLRYKEWITEVESFQSSTSNTMMIRSLEDLIMLAIDVQSRAIHVNQTDEYFVIDGSVVYGYTEHGDPNAPPRAATFGIQQTREQAEELEELEESMFSIDSTTADESEFDESSDPFISGQSTDSDTDTGSTSEPETEPKDDSETSFGFEDIEETDDKTEDTEEKSDE